MKKIIKPPNAKTKYGKNQSRKLFLLRTGLYTIHSPYLLIKKSYISSFVLPSLIWSLITNFIVEAKSELESAIDCPWQTKHLKFLYILIKSEFFSLAWS